MDEKRESKLANLRPGARVLWSKALKLPGRFGHETPGLNHFLFALLDRHGAMAESLASGLTADDYRRDIERRLKQGNTGTAIDPKTLLSQAVDQARRAGKEQVSERDLATLLLRRDGWTILDRPVPNVPSQSAGRTPILERESDPDAGTAAESYAYRPRACRPTPHLENYGRDLCAQALAGRLTPILGRELEIQTVMQTLCRWTKRNPLLIGPAGVGKTAIVEGLAQRIARGDVPPPLAGIRLFGIQSSALISGARHVGDLEERMEAVVEEASQDGIVVFIDEVHTIVGGGGQWKVSDIGSHLKPALANGDIACIGATTDEEFHQFIKGDRALERRFQPLRVQELSTDATLAILNTLRERTRQERGVDFADDALDLIILLARQYMRNRYFPDKAIDVFEHCAVHAVLKEKAEVDPPTVQSVVERLVGIPSQIAGETSRRLSRLKHCLINQAFCPEAAAERITKRLEVTTHGLDIAPTRPNAVLLVSGGSDEPLELAARVLADALYGTSERLIEIDMTRFNDPSDANWLLGAPPGYVGHDQVMDFKLQLAQKPWCVLLFKNAGASHARIQAVLAQALRSGTLNDARGRKVYLSDAIVVLTLHLEEASHRRVGFMSVERADAAIVSDVAGPSSALLPDLVEVVDVAWSPAQPTMELVESWLKDWIFPPLANRYRRRGLEVIWDPSVVAWLSEEAVTSGSLARAERLIEGRIIPRLVSHINQPGLRVLCRIEDGGVCVVTEEGD